MKIKKTIRLFKLCFPDIILFIILYIKIRKYKFEDNKDTKWKYRKVYDEVKNKY